MNLTVQPRQMNSTPAWKQHAVNLRWGALNVRTLRCNISNAAGLLQVEGADPTKPYRICDQLASHNISLCALSETRWKGEGSFSTNSHLFLFSGLPVDSERSTQGVAFVLDNAMQKAWRNGGSVVASVGGRLIRIVLKIAGRFIHVIGVYAPTFREPDGVEEEFYANLRALMASCKAHDELVILGDFNARVGIRETSSGNDPDLTCESSDLMLGSSGNPELNDNGCLLLDFCRECSHTPLRVMSTYFQHKHYSTWQHNLTKQWHQIDHVLAKGRSASLFKDVQVLTGIDWDSDHRIVTVKLRVLPTCKQPWGRKQPFLAETRIPKLNTAILNDPVRRAQFNKTLFDMVKEGLASDMSLWHYAVRRSALATCGELPRIFRPQWQLDNAEELSRLAKIKQQAFLQRGHSYEAAQHYKQIVRSHKYQVRRILNQWWQHKAAGIQEEVDTKGPNHQFEGFKQLRKVFQTGLRPPVKLRGPDGELLSTREARLARWEQYFSDLLNVEATVDPSCLASLAPIPTQDALGELPSFAEVAAAFKQLKAGKAHGPDGIQPEILSAMSLVNQRIFHEFLCRVWSGVDEMPPEWKANYLIPLPKSGDLSVCDRWRGLLLSSVPGKIFSRIINSRLQRHLEQHNILPEPQCGFRKTRGTTDMIFTLRMALELARSKSHPLYVLFVDLAKAYDSVSRSSLWDILLRKGVPSSLVTLIRAFYSGKEARVSVEGVLSGSFSLDTGLGQGCCLAPTLFNIFLGAVMEDWYSRQPPALRFHYRIDGFLRRHVDNQTLYKYSSWETLMLHDLGYADDAAFLADTYERLASLSRDLRSHYTSWGLTLAVAKTEALTTGAGAMPPPIPVPLSGVSSELRPEDMIHFTSCFKYLGSQISTQGDCVQEIMTRLDLARKAFWRLTSHVWDVAQLSLHTKLRVYRACVLSVLLYGAESWTTTFTCRHRLEKFHMRCLRKISHVSLWQQEEHHLTNTALRERLGVPSILQMVSQCRLRWLGHLARMPDSRIPKQILFAFLPPDVGAVGSPGKRSGKWLQYDFVNDIKSAGIDVSTWYQFARKDHGSEWRQKVFSVAPWGRPVAPLGNPAPRRLTQLGKSSSSRKQSFEQVVFRLERDLRQGTEDSEWLNRECQLGGRVHLAKRLVAELQTALGLRWYERTDLLFNLDELGDWQTCLLGETDLVLASLVLDCCRLSHASLHPVRPRYRLDSKRPREHMYHPADDRPPVAEPTAVVRGVRQTKKDVNRLRLHADGDYVCGVCQRRFPKAGGLARHIELTHTEGTFRAHGFQCSLCPCLFARQSAHTSHLERDHAPDSAALVCPHCRGVFPGMPVMLLHLAQEHLPDSSSFPGPCPLCPAPAPHMATLLTFKRHRTSHHMRDFPIAVFDQG